jgi:hypothetical protein
VAHPAVWRGMQDRTRPWKHRYGLRAHAVLPSLRRDRVVSIDAAAPSGDVLIILTAPLAVSGRTCHAHPEEALMGAGIRGTRDFSGGPPLWQAKSRRTAAACATATWAAPRASVTGRLGRLAGEPERARPTSGTETSEVPAICSAGFTRSRFAGPSVTLGRGAMADRMRRGVIALTTMPTPQPARTATGTPLRRRALLPDCSRTRTTSTSARPPG